MKKQINTYNKITDMKKILFLFVVALLFSSCSKDDDSKMKDQTILVNVFYKYSNDKDKTIASPSLVYLYDYSDANGFDKDKSIMSMGDYQELTMPDGTSPKQKYESDSFTGINTIKGIKNGKYIVTVLYKPDGFSFPMFYYYGYKVVEINSGTNLNTYDFVFPIGNDSYGKFKEF